MSLQTAARVFRQFVFLCLLVVAQFGLVTFNCSGSTWTFQSVDSVGRVGLFSSLAIDVNGYPHISYFDETLGDLKYATWNGSGWSVVTVDDAGAVGEYSSLVLDSHGYPHISYLDLTSFTKHGLKYACWNGSAWNIQTVDSYLMVNRFTSMALDASENPHILYCDQTIGDIKIAAWTGSAWNFEIVDKIRVPGSPVTIILEPDGSTRISYVRWLNSSSIQVVYAEKIDSEWNYQPIDTITNEGGIGGTSNSLALDRNGNPLIVYHNLEKRSVMLANRTGRSWQIVSLDSGEKINNDCVIASNFQGNLGVCYSNNDRTLTYLSQISTGWVKEQVNENDQPLLPSLVIDSEGIARVSYFENSNEDLKYGYLIPPISITFDKVGVSDYKGYILTVDSQEYDVNELPKTFMWETNSSHSFSFADSLRPGSSDFLNWTSTDGLSSLRSGTISVSYGGRIVGNYGEEKSVAGTFVLAIVTVIIIMIVSIIILFAFAKRKSPALIKRIECATSL
jgi:hypothetical protein